MTDDFDNKENGFEPELPITQQLVNTASELINRRVNTEEKFLDLLLQINDRLMTGRVSNSPGWTDRETLRDALKSQLNVLMDSEKDVADVSIYLSDSTHRLFLEVDREYPQESNISLNSRDPEIDPEVLSRWEEIKPEDK